MDRIDRFRIFARVVECGNFTRAADRLGLPRSSVSAAILALEEQLGARLLHRTTRRVSLTQDGAVFHTRCMRLLGEIDETEALFRQDGATAKGTVRIDVPSRIGRLVIAPALPDFLRRYPQLEIELGVADRAVDLIEDGVDCALRVGQLGESRLIARPVGDLPLVNVASPAYLDRHGVPRTPDDLTHHLAVRYASPASGRVEDWEWVAQNEQRAIAMPGRVTVNNAEAYIACCVAGLGLIQIPAYDVKVHLAAGELVEVLADWRAAPLPMSLLYTHRQHLSHRLRLFADWLQELLRRELLG